MLPTLPLALLPLLFAAGSTGRVTAPASPTAPATVPHCQVPCGIYGDKMRIAMILEDAATIRKGMTSITQLGSEGTKNYNQIVRWTLAKDEHAAHIQELVASYWLAQRIKAPQQADDAAARSKYLGQLELLHGVTVAAMKCKQTTDLKWVETLSALVEKFSATYFSKEDLEHLRDHHDH